MTEIVIHEVGLRDGLQMEQQVVSTEQKVRWIESLLESGVDIIQLGSFVHPLKVPQMADTDELFKRVPASAKASGKRPVLSALVLNDRGLDRGLAVDVEMFCMGVSASETHSRKNTGRSVVEATEQIICMAQRALGADKRVQVSVQSAFGCGYEGPVPESRVMGIVRRFLDGGIRAISLADTAGHAVPDRVEALFGAILDAGDDLECACHFHDTYGLALANTYAALKTGVKYFEASVAGLGGCPFTARAGGNLCTEDLVHYLQQTGARRDIDLDRLIALAKDFGAFFGREMEGSVHKTGAMGPAAEARP